LKKRYFIEKAFYITHTSLPPPHQPFLSKYIKCTLKKYDHLSINTWIKQFRKNFTGRKNDSSLGGPKGIFFKTFKTSSSCIRKSIWIVHEGLVGPLFFGEANRLLLYIFICFKIEIMILALLI